MFFKQDKPVKIQRPLTNLFFFNFICCWNHILNIICLYPHFSSHLEVTHLANLEPAFDIILLNGANMHFIPWSFMNHFENFSNEYIHSLWVSSSWIYQSTLVRCLEFPESNWMHFHKNKYLRMDSTISLSICFIDCNEISSIINLRHFISRGSKYTFFTLKFLDSMARFRSYTDLTTSQSSSRYCFPSRSTVIFSTLRRELWAHNYCSPPRYRQPPFPAPSLKQTPHRNETFIYIFKMETSAST